MNCIRLRERFRNRARTRLTKVTSCTLDNMAGLVNFEDEKEVKQFLDNLEVEYSFQCYKENDPEGNFY